MQLSTTRFGEIEVDDHSVITFTQPILGFQDFRRFVLLPGPEQSGLSWLQSIESGDLAFILMDPRAVMPDYTVELRQSELAELAVSKPEELAVYTLVVVPEDRSQTRTNLKAPVLINMKQRLGKQAILDRGSYPIRFYLAKAQEGTSSPREVSNARTDA